MSDTLPTPDRRFPRPWKVVEHSESFEIRDASGDPIAYVYFEDTSARANMTKRMNSKQARKIANRIAKIGSDDE